MENIRIAIIGLGYVGLPLAVEFGKKYQTLGFDINKKRIIELESGIDTTDEVTKNELLQSSRLSYSLDKNDIKDCDVYIVTVPTPVNKDKEPDLFPIISATKMIGEFVSSGNTVIYESTVYPGLCEEVCLPILEEKSSLELNKDFFLGYSPERINPGDKEHRLVDILKITSGSNEEALDFVDSLYSSIINAGTYRASSIKVAEAAKIIENTQRDVNIALINELSIIFEKLNINTGHVLEAAGTKWNFLKFKPGLVGGHCIGVDPYYLTYKANQVNYDPKIILAGRNLNDSMGSYIAQRLMEKLEVTSSSNNTKRILILGLTFKENCPDIRNTQVIEVIHHLENNGLKVDCYDPLASKVDSAKEYKISLIDDITP